MNLEPLLLRQIHLQVFVSKLIYRGVSYPLLTLKDLVMNYPINQIKQKFLTGTRIELIALQDPYTKLKTGDTGTVDFVDENGTIHMKWDTGSNLGLIPGDDAFRIIEKPTSSTVV